MIRREDSGGAGRAKARARRPFDSARPTGAAVRIFTRAEVREVDRLCVEQYGIPSIVLMENAAIGLAGVARDAAWTHEGPGRVLVVCGRGNNGGDGLAAARRLANQMGLAVIDADEASPGASLDAAIEGLGGSPAVIVDALLGTGVDRPVT